MASAGSAVRHRRWRRAAVTGLALAAGSIVSYGPVAVSGPAPRASAASGPTVAGTNCPSFPSDAAWNTPVTGLPVAAQSSAWLASMDSATTFLHPDYGPSGGFPYGIPWTVVGNSTPTTAISFQYASESDPGPYPFTASTPIEGGPAATGDRHAIMVNSQTCTLYELYDAQYSPSGSTAGSGAVWSLTSDALRPAGYTSADAAGLPIQPLLVDYDQVSSGSMDHAIRMTVACTQQSYVWPARHQAGQPDAACPPMGARFRLESTFNLPASECSAFCQTVLTTMKTYGLIVADNGSNWYFQGSADSRWTYDEVDQLKQIPASAFQAVDTSCLQVSPNSLQAYQPGSAGYVSRCTQTNDCAFITSTVGISPVQVGTRSGYVRVDSDGQVCATGSAVWKGDLAGADLAAPIVGITATPTGKGYWLLGADGGIFCFGDARFFGSTGNVHLAAPVVGMAVTPSNRGYWIVARDGGMFAFGDARFFGSTGNVHLAAPVVGMAVAPRGEGYWLVASDGGVFNFGDSRFYGSLGSHPPPSPVVDLATVAGDDGYYLVDAAGQVFAFGPGA